MQDFRKSTFTLLELLIVIVIIAILMSLLMPSLSKTRERSKRVVCLSNLKQTGIALALYAKDFKQYMPPGNASINQRGIDSTYSIRDNGGSGLAFGVAYLITEKYLNDAQLFYCPSWTHPYLQNNVLSKTGEDRWKPTAGTFGGWPSDWSKRPTWHIGISYHYRSTFGSGRNEPPNLINTPSSASILTDHFVKRYVLLGSKYGHREVYNSLYLDGHSAMIKNDNDYIEAVQSSATNRNWAKQEEIFSNFFDDN